MTEIVGVEPFGCLSRGESLRLPMTGAALEFRVGKRRDSLGDERLRRPWPRQPKG